MDFGHPKFRPKTPSGSGLTSALNRDTQQGFSRFDRQDRKSKLVKNEANAIDSYPKIAHLKFIIFGNPKFRPKTTLRSGLTSALNKGTQQGFGRFDRQDRKSKPIENEANTIDYYPKFADLKFIIWTSKTPNSIQKLPQEVG